MGDVGEGPRVDEDGRAFERLHQGGFERVLHQHGHGTGHAEVLGRDGLPLPIKAHHHGPQTVPHVLEAGGQRQHGHDLAGHGDVEARRPREALFLLAQAHRDAAEEAVAGIQDAAPGEGGRIEVQAADAATLLGREVLWISLGDAELRATQLQRPGELPPGFPFRENPLEQLFVRSAGLVQDAGVDGGRAEVVGRGDGVDVPCEVEVEVLHGDHLAVAAPGRAALDAEGGALAGLADAGGHALAQMGAQGLAEAHGGGGLAFAQGRGRDGGDIDVTAIRTVPQALQHLQPDLRLGGAIELELVLAQSQLRRHLPDGLEGGRLGDVQIRGYRGPALQDRG